MDMYKCSINWLSLMEPVAQQAMKIMSSMHEEPPDELLPKKLCQSSYLSKQTNFCLGKEGNEGDSPCGHHRLSPREGMRLANCEQLGHTVPHLLKMLVSTLQVMLQTMLVKCLEVQTLSTKPTFMIKQAKQEKYHRN